MKYLKYRIPFNLIHQRSKNYKNLIIYIDLNSIARGFYNREVILYELSNYIETRNSPTLLINELKEFLNNLYSSFKYLNPKFCIFFDTGQCAQNKNISNKYKINRTNESKSYIDTDEDREIYYQIKNYYFDEIYSHFNKKNLCKIIYLKDYESDFVPYYFIKKYQIDQNPDTLNLILSVDKDLLQCCQLNNTIQSISVYIKSQSKIESLIYDDITALKFIYKKFEPDGFITSKYIPLILALSGDKSDGIDNIKKGMGVANAIKLIKLYKMPHDFNSTYQLPLDLQQYKLKLQSNLSMISFERQIDRIPKHVLDQI